MTAKRRLARLLIALAGVLVAGLGSTQQSGWLSSTGGGMKIRIVIDGKALTARLEDNVASREFAALLPIDLTLTDYNGIEKVADLPSRLPSKGVPEGVDPDIGDITYYAPWGNLALFYRDFGYSRGLVRLGRIESGVERLAGGSVLGARFEQAEDPK